MKQMPKLSKSRYMNGIQCLKSLYLTCYQPEDKDEESLHSRYIKESGTRVGILARRLFKVGILIDHDHTKTEEALEETQKALKDKSVQFIYEAAFLYKDILIRVDILQKNEDDTFDVIEVKSSTKVKKEYPHDISIQVYVLENLGYKVAKTILAHINSEYVYPGGEYSLQDLFSKADVTGDVRKVLPNVPSQLKRMRETLALAEAPNIEVGSHCKNPHRCVFFEYCHKDLSRDHISNLYKITAKKLKELRDSNIILITEIPNDFDLNETQQKIKKALINKKLLISPQASKELSNLEFPIYFMDFETTNPPLPIFRNSRPWEQIPFQWSVHILSEDGKLTHKEFLPTDTEDPRKDFAQKLLESLGETGSVVVYYDSFEKGIVEKLAQHLGGDIKVKLLNINERVFDLYNLVYENIYHPEFMNSFSIKKVLPALVPSMSYSEMNISDGSGALIAYQKFLEAGTSLEERNQIRRDLLEYCKLDTLAMVEIYKKLLVKVGT